MNFDDYLPPRSAPRPGREGGVWQALRQIPDGGRVVVPPMSATPVGLMHALAETREGWTDLELATGNLFTHLPPLDHPNDPFRFSTYQTSGPMRDVELAGALEHIPATYAQVPTLFRPDGPLPADAILIQVRSRVRRGCTRWVRRSAGSSMWCGRRRS